MRRQITRVLLAMTAAVCVAATAIPALADPHPGQSVNVMVIDDFDGGGGGTLPSTTSGPTGSFTDFTFTTVAPAAVNAASLASVDTVLLNVGSSGMGCTTASLTAQAKTDLVNFLNGGGKLIIYDSECQPSVDYSWLPKPFTTSNPGALGASGTANIVENNLLGTNTAGVHFIDTTALGSDTDAIGDMNVLTTQDPGICLHISGTNATPVTGPTHVYYQSGSGLLIYNGMDIDASSDTTVPEAGDSSNPEGNIAKIWLQELQQPLNGQGLSCAVVVTGISLSPLQATNPTGSSHTVTATRLESGVGVPGTLVTFTVTGTHAGATGTCNPASCITDANGQVAFTYTGATVGSDQIVACFTDEIEVCSAAATKTWVTPPPPTPTTPASAATAPATQQQKKKKCKKGFVKKNGKCVKKKVKAKQPGFTG